MTTIEKIEDFAKFARSVAEREGDAVSIDLLYDRWRDKVFENEDALAVMASVRDLEAGERGRPVEEFLATFDAKRNADKTK